MPGTREARRRWTKAVLIVVVLVLLVLLVLLLTDGLDGHGPSRHGS